MVAEVINPYTYQILKSLTHSAVSHSRFMSIASTELATLLNTISF